MSDSVERRVVLGVARARLSPADEQLRIALLDMAEANYAQYPQYRGMWDDWMLAEMSRDAFGKDGSLTAAEGTPVLVSPTPIPHLGLLQVFIPSQTLLGNHAVQPDMVRPRSRRDRSMGSPDVT